MTYHLQFLLFQTDQVLMDETIEITHQGQIDSEMDTIQMGQGSATYGLVFRWCSGKVYRIGDLLVPGDGETVKAWYSVKDGKGEPVLYVSAFDAVNGVFFAIQDFATMNPSDGRGPYVVPTSGSGAEATVVEELSQPASRITFVVNGYEIRVEQSSTTSNFTGFFVIAPVVDGVHIAVSGNTIHVDAGYSCMALAEFSIVTITNSQTIPLPIYKSKIPWWEWGEALSRGVINELKYQGKLLGYLPLATLETVDLETLKAAKKSIEENLSQTEKTRGVIEDLIRSNKA